MYYFKSLKFSSKYDIDRHLYFYGKRMFEVHKKGTNKLIKLYKKSNQLTLWQ
nr:MAG: hypothetical protein [Microviridae sp.]